ncbi:hypothetical protein PQR39_42185 [Paraburkholderia sediminicola]|uniref:hypothetical protein n=1 Tax=Paraburkholderia sediminicola TaxID=458836 RepID=UPI0038B842E6
MPVQPQDLEQPRRQHHIAILTIFTLIHANHHALAINIGDLQVHDFRHAQPAHATEMPARHELVHGGPARLRRRGENITGHAARITAGAVKSTHHADADHRQT